MELAREHPAATSSSLQYELLRDAYHPAAAAEPEAAPSMLWQQQEQA